MFYRAMSFDLVTRSTASATTGEPADREYYRAARNYGAPVGKLEFTFDAATLPTWPYFMGVRTVFSRAGRDVISAHLGTADRIRFFEYTVTLAGGISDEVHVALPTEHVDVLSPWSTVAPNGVAQWWALDLAKLRDRSFFIVPEASTDVVMRGDLILALHEIGWPGYVYELRVMDGKHMVAYEEWAEHPEWTHCQPPQ
ncbi:hypothetical protein [Demequina activiva]|nr:hypothetical protein [Demequina activiva]